MTVICTKEQAKEIILAYVNSTFSPTVSPFQHVRFMEKYHDGSGEGEVTNISYIEVTQ